MEHHDHSTPDMKAMGGDHKDMHGDMKNMVHPMGHAGHDHHAMMIADFKKRFYIVLVLTVPIMLLSETIQHWLNIHIQFPGSNYLILLLSSIVFFYGGWPFLTGWWQEMKTWKHMPAITGDKTVLAKLPAVIFSKFVKLV